MSAQEQALLVKGFLLGKEAPAPIMEAIDVIIGSLAGQEPKPAEVRKEIVKPDPAPSPDQPSETSEPSAEPERPRKRRSWSDEARAAAGERMRARIAAGLMKRKGNAPGEALALP